MRGIRVDLGDHSAHTLAGPPVVPLHGSVDLCLRPRFDGRPAGIVAAVPVDEEEPAEALARKRVEQVDEHRAIRLDAERRAAGIRGEIGGQPIGQRGQHEHAEWLSRLDGDALGEDAVDAKREVGVLLDGAERDDEPVLAVEVLLDLHPVAILDLHRATSS